MKPSQRLTYQTLHRHSRGQTMSHGKTAIIVLTAGTLLGLATAVGVTAWPSPAKIGMECRISLPVGADDKFVELVLTNEETIKTLIEEPLAKAKVDPSPARYAVFGVMTLTRKDGPARRYTLYCPLGHFSQQGKYYTADFSALRAEFKKNLRTAMDFTD